MPNPSKTKLRPLGKRIVIERLPLPETTESGLLVLGREWPSLGRVINFPNWVRWLNQTEFKFLWTSDWLDQNDLRIGDLVYYNRAATELRSIPGEPNNFVLDIEDLYVRIRE